MISFGVWAPDEATFWASWIGAGIATEPGRLAPSYAECIQTTADSWDGIVSRNGVAVPGWHCNVRLFGAVEAMFRAGCPADGDIWQQTHAAQAFGLTDQPADMETGFPAGMRSPSGVVYADVHEFTSPSNVWA
jgi:hypothetical protein